jgi:tripartite-type tricarboxylate transporter receptor subunit TctC
MKRRVGLSILCLALLVVLTGTACAPQDQAAANYPARDLTLIVPLNAGGGYDLTARMLVPFLQKNLPKQVNIVVKNLGAAGGREGYFELYDAAADGYTIGLVDPGILAMAQVLGQAGTRDANKMTYLGRAAYQPFLLVLSAANYKSADQIKGKPVRASETLLNQAGATLLLRALGATPTFILYNGSADAILAAARGESDASALTFATMWKAVADQQGKIIPVMVASQKRLPQAPDVPTPAELGLKLSDGDLATAGGQYVIVAPPNLPSGIKKTLEDALQKALKDPDFIAQMNKANYMPDVLSGDDTAKMAAGMLTSYMSMKDILPK